MEVQQAWRHVSVKIGGGWRTAQWLHEPFAQVKNTSLVEAEDGGKANLSIVVVVVAVKEREI